MDKEKPMNVYICLECDRIYTYDTTPSAEEVLDFDSVCLLCGGNLEEILPGGVDEEEIDEKVRRQNNEMR